MGSFIASLATLFVLAMAGAFAVPLFVDWNQFKPQIERYAEEAIGQPVRIEGDVALTVLPEFRFRASRIVVLDEDAAKPVIIQADAVNGALSLPALFSGKVEVKELELLRPALRLRVDENGRANWSKLAFQPALPPFLAQSPAFSAVEVKNGTVAYEAAEGEPLRLEEINGTLQAEENGPGRFTGYVKADGKRLDINATASGAIEEKLQIKAAVKHAENGVSAQFDGELSNRAGSFQLAGVAKGTATLAIQSGESAERQTGVQFAGKIEADETALAVTEAEVTLNPDDAPQVLTGSARLAGSDLEVAIAGKVFNWNALSAPREGQNANAPAGQGALPVAPLQRWLSSHPAMRVRAALAFGQIVTGDEVIEQTRAVVSRVEGRWLAESVSAQLPGNTQLTLAGTIAGGDSRFSGIVDVNGGNFSRFVKWLYPDTAEIGTRLAQKFSLKGSVVLDGTLMSLEGAVGQIGEAPFQGSLRYDSANNGKLALNFSSDKLSLGELNGVPFLDGKGIPSPLARAASEEANEKNDETSPLLGWLAGMDEVDLNVNVAQIDFRSFQAHKLLARLRVQSGLVDVHKLNFETSDQLVVSANGRLKFGGEAFEGQLRSVLEASTPAAVRRALHFAGVELAQPKDGSLDALTPARMNVQISAEQDTHTANLNATGSLGGSKVRVQGKLSRPQEGADVLSLDSEIIALDGNALAGQVLTLAGYEAVSSGQLAPGRLTLQLQGPLDKMDGTLTLATPTVSGEAKGMLALPSGSSPEFDGRVRMTLSGMERYFPDTPVIRTFAGSGQKLEADASLTLKDRKVSLTGISLTGSGNNLSGDIKLDRSGAKPSIDAELEAKAVPVPALLSLLLNGSHGPAINAGLQSSRPDFWSDRPFDLDAFRTLQGSITLKADRMDFADGFATESSKLDVRLEDGAVRIAAFRGEFAGARLRASGALLLKDGKVRLEGKSSVGGLKLASLGEQGRQPLVSAKASASLSFSGEGLSPRGLVSVLSGRGRVSITSGRLNGLLPSAIEKSAAAALKLSQPIEPFALEAVLVQAMQSGGFKFRPLKAMLALDGATITMKSAVFRRRNERVRVSGDLDLLQLQLDSEWVLVPSARSKNAWPPVKVVYAGALAEIGSLERRLEFDEFYRAFTMRKMEQDVERLERLNGAPRTGTGWSTSQEQVRSGRSPRPLPPGAPGLAPGNLPPGVEDLGPRKAQAFQDQIKAILQQHNTRGRPASSQRATQTGSITPSELERLTPQGPAMPAEIDLPARRPTRPAASAPGFFPFGR